MMKGGGSDSGGVCVLESEGNGWVGSDGGGKEGGGVVEGRRREGE